MNPFTFSVSMYDSCKTINDICIILLESKHIWNSVSR